MEEGLAELTMAPSCVVLTCIAHASTHIARCQIQGHVKVTTAGMPMAEQGRWIWSRLSHGKYGLAEQGVVPTLAGMGMPKLCCTPWVVLVQILAVLTVSCAVMADTKAMHLAGRRAR